MPDLRARSGEGWDQEGSRALERAVHKAKARSRLAKRSRSPAAAESGTLLQMGEKACGAGEGEQSVQ
jgi:hypothetical protein